MKTGDRAVFKYMNNTDETPTYGEITWVYEGGPGQYAYLFKPDDPRKAFPVYAQELSLLEN